MIISRSSAATVSVFGRAWVKERSEMRAWTISVGVADRVPSSDRSGGRVGASIEGGREVVLGDGWRAWRCGRCGMMRRMTLMCLLRE